MKFYLKNGTVFCLESADKTFTEVSESEAMKLIKPSDFHEWDGEGWIDPRTDDEVADYNRSKLGPLTNRQFKLALLDAELLDDVELAISSIEDPTLKRRIQIEYEYATTFNRDSESIAVMVGLLELSTDIVDEMWIKALTL